MKKLLTIPFMLLLMTVLTNCGGSAQSVQPNNASATQSLPDWYTQTPPQNNKVIYGLGMGEDRKKALHEALNDAVATLNTSVSSSYQHTTNVNNANGDESYSKETQASIDIVTQEVELNNYKVVHQLQLAKDSFIVMVEIDKYKLFTSLYSKLENSFTMLNIKLQNKSHDLEKIMIYHKYLAQLNTQLSTLGILSALDPSFDDEELASQYRQRSSEYNALVEHKLFKLQSDDTDKEYMKQIKAGLMQDGLKLTNNNSYDYLIQITSTEIEDLSIQRNVLYILKTSISIGISDYKTNKDISFTTFDIESRSYDGTNEARELNCDKLKDKIVKHGIFNIPST